MPHVVIDEEPDLAAVLDAFEPETHREGATIAKTEEAFIDRDETSIVVRGLGVEEGQARPALVRVDAREGDGVVRLEEAFRPEVHDAVMRLVALVAHRTLQVTEAGVDRTNVQAQLDAVRED
jgi:hypothetical protein